MRIVLLLVALTLPSAGVAKVIQDITRLIGATS